MVKHRSSTRIAARLASVAVAVGLVVLPQVGASAQAQSGTATQAHSQLQAGQATGGGTALGGGADIKEWNGTGA
ncbi:hypothetical protein [Kitasatospora sp. NPDC056531]|uniref:hypothetical protein n=1 Tax=Kitasatospora sp. NPDC056531 TaxID=3345856 RepID=UPI0036974873